MSTQAKVVPVDSIQRAEDRREQINTLLSSTYDALYEVEERVLENEETRNLTLAEIHTIEAIGVEGRFAMGTVAARLGVTLGTLTTTVNRLVYKGYVDRERSQTDRRCVLIGLTSRGRTAYRVHKHFHNKLIAEATAGLSIEEQDAMIRALSSMNAFLCSLRDGDDT